MNKKDKLYELVIDCQMLESKTESFLRKAYKENKLIQNDLFKRIGIDEKLDEFNRNMKSLIDKLYKRENVVWKEHVIPCGGLGVSSIDIIVSEDESDSYIDEIVDLKKELSNNYDSLVEFSKEKGIDGNLPYSLFWASRKEMKDRGLYGY